MKISEIAEHVWKNCLEIEFDKTQEWDSNTFLTNWAKEKQIEETWRGMRAGWYWLCAKTTLQKLCNLEKPSSLPAKGCNISLTAKENQKIFGTELLCEPPKENWITIYNGHEKNIKQRIRAHFSLNNDKTGAIGLAHYPISTWEWKVRLFSENQIGIELTDKENQRIKDLMHSKSGRCAIESAWRVKYGWPIPCKE